MKRKKGRRLDGTLMPGYTIKGGRTVKAKPNTTKLYKPARRK